MCDCNYFDIQETNMNKPFTLGDCFNKQDENTEKDKEFLNKLEVLTLSDVPVRDFVTSFDIGINSSMSLREVLFMIKSFIDDPQNHTRLDIYGAKFVSRIDAPNGFKEDFPGCKSTRRAKYIKTE